MVVAWGEGIPAYGRNTVVVVSHAGFYRWPGDMVGNGKSAAVAIMHTQTKVLDRAPDSPRQA
jgi:hypothetical protein